MLGVEVSYSVLTVEHSYDESEEGRYNWHTRPLERGVGRHSK